MPSQNGFPWRAHAFDAAERRLISQHYTMRFRAAKNDVLRPSSMASTSSRRISSEENAREARPAPRRASTTRRVLDERVEQQEAARREERRELRENLSFQKPRHVDEVKRPRERRPPRP